MDKVEEKNNKEKVAIWVSYKTKEKLQQMRTAGDNIEGVILKLIKFYEVYKKREEERMLDYVKGEQEYYEKYVKENEKTMFGVSPELQKFERDEDDFRD